ncbi:MAG: endopeptidase La [bacterium]
MKDKFRVMLLKELVILPNQEIKIELLTDVSMRIVDDSVEDSESKVLVVAPLSQKESEPSFDDLPKIGVIASIKSKFILPNGNMRVTLFGEQRVIVKGYFYNKGEVDVLRADTLVLKLPKFNVTEESAVRRKLIKSIKSYISLNKAASNSVLTQIDSIDDLDMITDVIAKFLPFNVSKKLEYMQMINPIVRGKSLIEDIEEELEIIKLEITIDKKVQDRLFKHEKDFFIKEKISILQDELGTVYPKKNEIKKFRDLLKKAKLEEKSHKKILNEIKKYEHATSDSPESNVIYNYLTSVLNLPWNNSTEEFLNAEIIRSILDSSHFGLENVKDRICEYAGIKKITGSSKSPIICLVGPPGVGKTSIASKIAESLNRSFVKISVGGLNDSLELTGSRRTYMGSSYGKVIDGINKSGVNNPLMLIDEVDKMVKDYKSDPASILLEILDQNQNFAFVDNYIEEPFDLSKVFFILTANDEESIPYILRDRLEIIHIDSYAYYEKEKIASKYLLPAIFKEYNVTKLQVKPEIVEFIIKNYTNEAGVRELSRLLHKLIRRVVIRDIKSISETGTKKLLGEFTNDHNVIYNYPNIGIVNTLACVKNTGLVSCVEVVSYKGDGNFTVTGNVEKVMDESIKVALTYIKVNYKINVDKYDFHIHFLEAGSKKDGPSGGVAITTAILSSFTEKPINNLYALTGEITLNGKILPVGGVKEKVIAAINNGIKKVFVPSDNKIDLKSIPKECLSNINVVYASTYDDIYEELFLTGYSEKND